MVTEKMLLGNRYKFKHVQIEILEKDEKDHVLAFAAIIVTTKLPGQCLSDGQIEINRTLWKEDSIKRPKGYWRFASPEKDGIMKSIFVSDEWLEETPKDIRQAKEAEWGM